MSEDGCWKMEETHGFRHLISIKNRDCFAALAMTMKQIHKQKLVILSVALFVLFNAPVLLLFNRADETAGVPLIYVYIFEVWLFSSVFSFLIFRKFDE